ncbi:MAG: hypothetical protein VX278_23390, partial [Myxococcota bacterium]|nr:hypothetical protein [Myxococcota bacterium]
KKIGLSLGADLCWPATFEALLKRLDLNIERKGKEIRFKCERIRVEPFDLQYKPKYDLVVDRVNHWYNISREWIKKISLMDDVYAFNNPWTLQSMEKHTSYCAMMRLGFPIPRTWMLPPKEHTKEEGDVLTTINRYNNLFSLRQIGEQLGYPAFLKPYDGGGWVGVRHVKNYEDLNKAYDQSGERVNHLQEAVTDWDIFVRGIGIGPQVNVIRYNPDAPLHDRYVVDFNYLNGDEWLRATMTTRVINAFFGWDFNSCEMLRKAETFHPIDFANACPDSQVTSLHYHFPWLVKSLLQWTIFCAATERKMQINQNWQPYFDIADTDLPFSEKLLRYDELAKKHFDINHFREFCQSELTHLDEIALEFFQTPEFLGIVRTKVAALYPKHEVEEFTNHFFGLVQFWCKTEQDRLTQKKSTSK